MNKYSIIGKIGEGAYGVVYKATTNSNKGRITVALKEFSIADEEHGLHPSAIRELALLATHSHPNLIPLLDMIRTKDKLVLVYPYQKYSLDRMIRASARRGLTAPTVRWYAFQLLRAVSYLHASAVLHRDIKPENILVGESGRLYVCDLGLSRSFGLPVAQYSPLVATLPYRAPELLVRCHAYGTACDVWSVGCVVAEMVLGDRLFPALLPRVEMRRDRTGRPVNSRQPSLQLGAEVNAGGTMTESVRNGASMDELVAQLQSIDDVMGLDRPALLALEGADAAILQRVRARGSVSLEARLGGRAEGALVEVLQQMLVVDPCARASCADLLRHPYFEACWDRLRQQNKHRHENR